MKQTERQKLAADLDDLEAWLAQNANIGPKTKNVLRAARRHLDSLPEPFWRVTGTKGQQPIEAVLFVRKERALDEARARLASGADAVSVQPYEMKL